MRQDILVITGPVASGKTALAERLLEEIPGSARMVTHTTRPPRRKADGTYEIHEKDYIFVDKVSFMYEYERLKAIFEFTERSGVYYGSSKHVIERLLRSSTLVIAVVDPKGVLSYKERYRRRVLAVSLCIPEEDALRRLTKRALSEESYDQRVKELLKDKVFLAEHRQHIDLWVDNPDGGFEGMAEKVLRALGTHLTIKTA
jgi:guanylate kinase